MWKGLNCLNLFIFTTGQEGAQNPVGKPWDVLEPKAASGRHWRPHMPEAHFRALIPALAFEHSAELWMQSYFIPLQAYRQSRIYFQRGVLFQSKSYRWVEETESVYFSLFLETEEPKLQPKPHMLQSHFLMTSALESPEMLPKGTSQKRLEEGRVDIGLKKRISIPWRWPQFPSKGGTTLTYLIPGSRSFFCSSLHGRPSGERGALFYTTGCLAVLWE